MKGKFFFFIYSNRSDSRAQQKEGKKKARYPPLYKKQKKTKDWLLQAPVLDHAGAEAPYINGGDVKNSGVELSVGYHNHIGKLNYHVNANFSKNKNEVQSVPTEDGIVHGLTSISFFSFPHSLFSFIIFLVFLIFSKFDFF